MRINIREAMGLFYRASKVSLSFWLAKSEQQPKILIYGSVLRPALRGWY